MELLTSLGLGLIDTPKRVICHCETRHGLPHRFAPSISHDAEAHYEAPFHVLAEVSSKRNMTAVFYQKQLAQGLKHGRSWAQALGTDSPVYALVINGGRIDKDRRLQKLYREFIERKKLDSDHQVRVVPMYAGDLAIGLTEIHKSLKPQQARFSAEQFADVLDTRHKGLLDIWKKIVISRALSKSRDIWDIGR